MIRHKTVTPLNYRTTVPVRSDFSRITKFPEVYHGYVLSKAAFHGAARPVTERR